MLKWKWSYELKLKRNTRISGAILAILIWTFFTSSSKIIRGCGAGAGASVNGAAPGSSYKIWRIQKYYKLVHYVKGISKHILIILKVGCRSPRFGSFDVRQVRSGVNRWASRSAREQNICTTFLLFTDISQNAYLYRFSFWTGSNSKRLGYYCYSIRNSFLFWFRALYFHWYLSDLIRNVILLRTFIQTESFPFLCLFILWNSVLLDHAFCCRTFFLK